MTALMDLPVTNTPDPRDPLSISAQLRCLRPDELAVALHLSGAKLTRAMAEDTDTLISLAEIGLAATGWANLIRYTARVSVARRALVIALQDKRPAEQLGERYVRMLGGARRATLCTDFSYRLAAHFNCATPEPFTAAPTHGPDKPCTRAGFPSDTATYHRA